MLDDEVQLVLDGFNLGLEATYLVIEIFNAFTHFYHCFVLLVGTLLVIELEDDYFFFLDVVLLRSIEDADQTLHLSHDLKLVGVPDEGLLGHLVSVGCADICNQEVEQDDLVDEERQQPDSPQGTLEESQKCVNIIVLIAVAVLMHSIRKLGQSIVLRKKLRTQVGQQAVKEHATIKSQVLILIHLSSQSDLNA